jgi:glycosyltransferase involved in cell wall biosynthesis
LRSPIREVNQGAGYWSSVTVLSESGRPLVTAIIPVFDGEDFVADAIDSVLSQTYMLIECLVVDDGSTDRTPEVLASFGDRIRVVRQDNAGVAAARNHGAREASGSLIAFLDADDCWLPEKITKQVAAADHRKPGLTYCGLYVTDRDLTRLGIMEAPPVDVALRNTLLLEPPVISVAQTSLMPREVFETVGGFDESLSTSADTDLACRVATAFGVTAVHEPLVLYRQHDAQMHLNADAMEHDMRIIFAKQFDTGVLPPSIQRLHRRARANLEYTLSASAFKDGDRQKAMRHLGSAVVAHPGRVAVLAWQRMTR